MNNRAVAHVIGYILLAGVFVLLLSIWQVQVVPNENANVEFDHQQAVTEDLVEVRNAIENAPEERSTKRSDVELGTTYPDRTLFVNPPPAVGQLRTESTVEGENATIVVENATAASGTGEVGPEEVWNGSTRTFDTSLLVYEPRYNELDSAPTFVGEHSVLYADYGDARINHTEQQLVDGTTVSVRALGGTLSENGVEDARVAAEPQGVGVRSVEVTNDSAGPITLELPTKRGGFAASEATAEREWEGLLSSELQDKVQDVTVENGTVAIELEPEETYEFAFARVDLSNPTASADAEPAYVAITDVDEQLAVGQAGSLTVEVRDEFDNPIPGEEVELDPDPLNETPVETRRDGTATIDYELGDDAELTVSHDEARDASVDIDVIAGDTRVQWNRSEVVLDEETVDEIELDDPPDDSPDLEEPLFVELEATSDLGDVPVTFGTEDQDAIVDDVPGLPGVPSGDEDLEDDEQFDAGSATAVYAIDRAVLDEDGRNVYVSGGGEGDRITVREPEPTIEVEIDDTNEPIVEGQELEVDVTVENLEDGQVTRTVDLEDFDGEVVDDEELTIDAEGSASTTLVWGTDVSDSGKGEITVRAGEATDSTSVTIEALAEFEVEIDEEESDRLVDQGESLAVNVTVTNTGEQPDTQTITLEDFDGNVVDTRSVGLAEGDSETFDLVWEDTISGDGDLTVESRDDSETINVLVSDPFFGGIIIDDTNSPVEAGDDLEVSVLVDSGFFGLDIWLVDEGGELLAGPEPAQEEYTFTAEMSEDEIGEEEITAVVGWWFIGWIEDTDQETIQVLEPAVVEESTATPIEADNNVEQTIELELGVPFGAEETIVVDIPDDVIDYGEGKGQYDVTPESIDLDLVGEGPGAVELAATEEINAGETIVLDLDGIDARDTSPGTYDVIVEDPNDRATIASFAVLSEGMNIVTEGRTGDVDGDADVYVERR